MTAREILITLHNRFNGDWEKIYDFIANKKEIGDLDLTNSDNLITLIDEEYPQELKQMYRPPFVITKEDAGLKKYRITITYEFDAYTDRQAQQKVNEFDIDIDNIVKVGKPKRV